MRSLRVWVCIASPISAVARHDNRTEHRVFSRERDVDASVPSISTPPLVHVCRSGTARVCIVPWGIDPSRCPWPSNEIDSEPPPGRHHIARDVSPGMTADGATLCHFSEPRVGDIIHPVAATEVAPRGSTNGRIPGRTRSSRGWHPGLYDLALPGLLKRHMRSIRSTVTTWMK